MRHKATCRQLGRSPKHRKALMRNMAANLPRTDRMVTTLAKAKELRPYIERIIHKAKRMDPSDHVQLKKLVRQGPIIQRLVKEIAPRFRNLEAGFTRVEHLGRRKTDSAEMGLIELVKNDFRRDEQNEIEVTLEMHDMMTYWDWENRLLDQEKDYYEDHLRRLKAKIDHELNKVLNAGSKVSSKEELEFLKQPIEEGQKPKKRSASKGLGKTMTEIKNEVEQKFDVEKQVLLTGY